MASFDFSYKQHILLENNQAKLDFQMDSTDAQC